VGPTNPLSHHKNLLLLLTEKSIFMPAYYQNQKTENRVPVSVFMHNIIFNKLTAYPENPTQVGENTTFFIQK